MDEINILIKKPLTSILALFTKFYYKINLFFNKYKIINKLYEPKIKEKMKINNQLYLKLTNIKSDNSKNIKQIKKIDKENIDLQRKISLMEELILRK